MSGRGPAAQDESASAETKTTVHYAIAANGSIAAVKGMAALFSGSPALVAETAHSLADTGNQLLLRLSLSRAERPPDDDHPFGYGRERFFWALLVAVLMFLVGAAASVAEGIVAILVAGHTAFVLAYVVLAIAFVAESVSLLRAYRELRHGALRVGWSFNRYVRASTDPTVKTVLFEDIAAVTGVVLAAAGVAAHQLTGRRLWEGVASIAIGGLLAAVAFAVGKMSKDLLIGRPATREERETIERIVKRYDEVDELVDLRTVHLGPDALFVALRVAFRSGLTTDEIERVASGMDMEMRQSIPDIRDVFVDPTDTRLRRPNVVPAKRPAVGAQARPV